MLYKKLEELNIIEIDKFENIDIPDLEKFQDYFKEEEVNENG